MKKKSLFKDSIFATIFILASLYGLSQIDINSDVVNPISKTLGDFKLTDVVFSQLRESPPEDSNIVLVNIGPRYRDRDDLANLINILNEYNPKVIGIDAFFRKEKPDSIDSPLVKAFSKVKHLVLVSEMHEGKDKVFRDSMETSHAKFMKYAEPGFADMITKGEDYFKIARECSPKEKTRKFHKWVDTILEVEYHPIVKKTKVKKDTTIFREIYEFGEKTTVKVDTTIIEELVEYGEPFKVKRDTSLWLEIYKDTTFYSFPVKMAMIFAPEKVKKFIARNKDTEIISFQGNIDKRLGDVSKNAKIVFTALDVEQVENRQFVPEAIQNKIVIIGYLGDELGDKKTTEDKFFTPLNANYIGKANPDMYGVVVHANIVSMILKEDYINEMPEWLNLALGFILIYIVIWFFSFLHTNTEMWYDGLSNLITLFLIVVLIGVVIYVFHKYNYIVDVTLPSVALFLTGNLIEIYFGILKPLFLKYGVKVPYINKFIPIFTEK